MHIIRIELKQTVPVTAHPYPRLPRESINPPQLNLNLTLNFQLLLFTTTKVCDQPVDLYRLAIHTNWVIGEVDFENHSLSPSSPIRPAYHSNNESDLPSPAENAAQRDSPLSPVYSSHSSDSSRAPSSFVDSNSERPGTETPDTELTRDGSTIGTVSDLTTNWSDSEASSTEFKDSPDTSIGNSQDSIPNEETPSSSPTPSRSSSLSPPPPHARAQTRSQSRAQAGN
ncbi:hypothetical protein N7490_002520 [Penicillium lividum]|nr:hypothetical protein N7490_002520 [Penicillium lividum]